MDKVKILRDLEYVSGGIVTLKALCNREDKLQGKYYELFQDWNELLYNIIDQIAKENENAKNN